MKTMKLIAILTFSATVLILTSCSKEDEIPKALDYINEITGNYTGTYKLLDGGNSPDTAYGDIRHMGGNKVELHCYGEQLDTTFMMDIYAHHDSIMLCATGDVFENIYGHMKSEYHMDHHGNTDTEWMHHIADDHVTGDKHFGGFDLNHHTLRYTFLIEGNGTNEYIRFEGVKKIVQ